MSAEPVEVTPADFPMHDETDEDGNLVGQWPELPDDLPFDAATCAAEGCGETVGMYLWEGEDNHGNERAGAMWSTTFRTHDGHYVCEDCAAMIRDTTPPRA